MSEPGFRLYMFCKKHAKLYPLDATCADCGVKHRTVYELPYCSTCGTVYGHRWHEPYGDYGPDAGDPVVNVDGAQRCCGFGIARIRPGRFSAYAVGMGSTHLVHPTYSHGRACYPGGRVACGCFSTNAYDGFEPAAEDEPVTCQKCLEWMEAHGVPTDVSGWHWQTYHRAFRSGSPDLWPGPSEDDGQVLIIPDRHSQWIHATLVQATAEEVTP